MNQWWQLWEQYFSGEECTEIVRLGLQREPSEASVGHGGVGHSDPKIRRSTVRWLDRREEDVEWIMRKMEHAFRTANCNAFQFDLTYFKEIQFTEYTGQQEGKYDWHEDLSWTVAQPSRRKLSMVVQLSDPDDYTGGLLELDTKMAGEEKGMVPSVRQMRGQGTLVVFPSFLKHRVTPVLKGTRHSLVSWYEGPPFR